MKRLSLIASTLAVLGLTACEKGLDVGVDGMSPDGGLVKNSNYLDSNIEEKPAFLLHFARFFRNFAT